MTTRTPSHRGFASVCDTCGVQLRANRPAGRGDQGLALYTEEYGQRAGRLCCEAHGSTTQRGVDLMSEFRADAPSAQASPPSIKSTGIRGLDEVLRGGLATGYLYLITGDPGSGKTTLALQFLIEGREQGERTLYLTLSETRGEIEAIGTSHGWSLEGIDLQEISADQGGEEQNAQTVFKAVEVELSEFRARLETAVDRANPDRVVIDSLSELRLLAGDSR